MLVLFVEIKGAAAMEMGSCVDCSLRVRYAETDQMGRAYHGNYLVWFEVGRSEYCRHHGFSYREMEESDRRYLVVAEARCRYMVPLRYDQVFIVRTRISQMRSRTITFEYHLLEEGDRTLYGEGSTIHVVTDEQGRPCRFPKRYRELLGG